MLRYAAVLIVALALVTGCATKSLVTATQEGDLDRVKQLMQSKTEKPRATDKCMAMIWAADYGYLEILKYLHTEGGVDVNCSAGGGWTPLVRASASNQMEILKYLLARGANVEVKTLFGESPLSSAAERGHAEVVRLLLSRGADLNGALGYLKTQLREDPKNPQARTGVQLLEEMKRQSGK